MRYNYISLHDIMQSSRGSSHPYYLWSILRRDMSLIRPLLFILISVLVCYCFIDLPVLYHGILIVLLIFECVMSWCIDCVIDLRVCYIMVYWLCYWSLSVLYHGVLIVLLIFEYVISWYIGCVIDLPVCYIMVYCCFIDLRVCYIMVYWLCYWSSSVLYHGVLLCYWSSSVLYHSVLIVLLIFKCVISWCIDCVIDLQVCYIMVYWLCYWSSSVLYHGVLIVLLIFECVISWCNDCVIDLRVCYIMFYDHHCGHFGEDNYTHGKTQGNHYAICAALRALSCSKCHVH